MKHPRSYFFPAISAALVLIAALALGHPAARAGAAPAADEKFILVVHGGAGDWNAPDERLDIARAAISKAAQTGYQTLSRGGSSLDAVEATLRVMEDSGIFDAGRGGYYTREGVPELDAAIMDGRTLNAGAVASVKHIANPISLARLVMEKTPHVLLVSAGAEEFAKSQGIDLVSPFYFYNERFWKMYQERKSKEENKSSNIPAPKVFGTVGAVALDQAGNLAAGTSTGGTTWKMPGRVGDSPIIGAGTYANNDSCGISGTGVGEFFIRNTVASDICARMRYLHVSLEQAANDVVKALTEQKGEAGVIGLDRQGHVATPFNTNGMIRATVRADGQITIKIFHE